MHRANIRHHSRPTGYASRWSRAHRAKTARYSARPSAPRSVPPHAESCSATNRPRTPHSPYTPSPTRRIPPACRRHVIDQHAAIDQIKSLSLRRQLLPIKRQIARIADQRRNTRIFSKRPFKISNSVQVATPRQSTMAICGACWSRPIRDKSATNNASSNFALKG